jgi:hypothetical protein
MPPAARAPSPRARRTRTAVALAPATRLLLEQCAGAAGTVAEEHATTLILRDAQSRGLLGCDVASAPSVDVTKAPRRSVIAPLTPEWEVELAAYPPPALC